MRIKRQLVSFMLVFVLLFSSGGQRAMASETDLAPETVWETEGETCETEIPGTEAEELPESPAETEEETETVPELPEEGTETETVQETESGELLPEETAEVREIETAAELPELADEDILEYIDRCLNPGAVQRAAEISEEMFGDTEVCEAETIQTEAGIRAQVTPVNHVLPIQYTLVDGNLLGGASDLTEMWEEHWEACLASYEIYAQMYEVDDREDCFVAFVNSGLMNGQGTALSMDLTNGDGLDPVIYDSRVTYDRETGLVYIPRSFFYGSGGEELAAGEEELKLQLMVSVDMDLPLQNAIRVTTENYRKDVAIRGEEQRITGRSLNVETTIPLTTPETAGHVDLSKVYIYLNDSVSYQVFEEGKYFFDRRTGELTIPVSPVTLYSVRVVIDDDTWLEKLEGIFADRVYAATAVVTDAASMLTVPDVVLEMSDSMKVGEYFDRMAEQCYADDTGDNYYCNYTEAQKKGVLDSGIYLYYPIVNTVNAAYINLIDKGSGDLSSLLSSKVVGTYTNDSLKWLYLNQFFFIADTPTGIQTTSGGSRLDLTELHRKLPWIALHCTHQSSSLGSHAATNSSYQDICRYRILDIDTKNRTVVLGLLVPKQQTQSGSAIYKFRYRPYGSLRAAKKGHATGEILAGAVYTVYQDEACTKVCRDVNGNYKLTTLAEKPYSNTLIYPEGTRVYVKESAAPAGTVLDPAVYSSVIEAGVTNWANGAKNVNGFLRDTEYVRLSLEKLDEETGELLAGAVYKGYQDFACTEAALRPNGKTMVWKTTEKGSNLVDCARKQTVWIRETTAPEGYGLSSDRYRVDLAGYGYRIRRYSEKKELLWDSGTVSYETDEKGVPVLQMTVRDRKETVEVPDFGLELIKTPAEENAGASMEGAVFALEYRREQGSGEPEKTWYFATDEEGYLNIRNAAHRRGSFSLGIGETHRELQSDPLPVNEAGEITYEDGLYTLREVSAPRFYRTEGTVTLLLEGEEELSEFPIAAGLSFLVTTEKGVRKVICDAYEITDPAVTVRVCDRVYENTLTVTKFGDGREPLKGVAFVLSDPEGNALAEQITGEDGIVLFEDLLPGDYILTEVKTAAGYELLTEALTLTLPLQKTPEEAEKEGLDTGKAYYDPVSGTYCFPAVTCEVTDHGTPVLPVTGSAGRDQWLRGGLGLLLILGVLLGGKHRRGKKE